MEEKKRKSSRSFELEKGVKRSFDLQKTSARKFDLEKNSNEVSLEELKNDLLADGKIDAEEVNKLREVLFADGKIDQDEADFLFEINDAVSGKPNDSSWKAFFVEAISDYLLNDERSPGVIDEEEGKWLVEKIGADGQVDGAEKQLLDHLKKNTKKMPASVMALLNSSVETEPDPVGPTGESTDKPKKGTVIVAAMAGLLALGGGAYYLLQNGNDFQSEEEIASQKVTPPEDGTSALSMASEIENGEAEGENIEAGNVDTENEESDNTEDEEVNPRQLVPENEAAEEQPSTNNNGGNERRNPVNPPVANLENREIQTTPSPSSPTGDVEQEALSVIRGDYGNGNVRRQRLGSRYDEIQSEVNELYRLGKVY